MALNVKALAGIMARGGSAGPSYQFVRMGTLTNVAETGDGSTGWIYTGTANGTNACQSGAADKNLGATEDGIFEATVSTVTGLSLVGLDNTAAATPFGSLLYGLFWQTSGFYSLVDNGSTISPEVNNITPAIGDKIRFRRTYGVVLVELSVDGGASWRTIHQFTATNTAALYPIINFNNIGAALSTPRALLNTGPASKFTATNVKIVWDGNSYTQAVGATASYFGMVRQAMWRPPVVSTPTTYATVGVSGQTVRQMNGLDGGSTADIDAAYDGTKTNVLVIMELTNSIWAGRSAVQTATDVADYIVARKAVNPWQKVMVMTGIPREGNCSSQADRDEKNGRLAACNAYLIANRAALGIDLICDLRQAGSPFAFTAYNQADFDATAGLWTASETAGNRVHPSDSGYAILADYIGAALAQLGI